MTAWTQVSSPHQASLSHGLAQGPPANDCTTLGKSYTSTNLGQLLHGPFLSLPAPLRVSTSGLYIHHSTPSFQYDLLLLFTCLPDSPSFEIQIFLGQCNDSHDPWFFSAASICLLSQQIFTGTLSASSYRKSNLNGI